MISITVDGVAYEVPSSAADTNWAAKQVAFEQAVATYLNTVGTAAGLLPADIAALQADVGPPTWITVAVPSYQNGWGRAGGVLTQYYKGADGTVHLRGALTGGSLGDPMFTLPAGYRPPNDVLVVAVDDGGVCPLTVAANGEVTVGAGSGDPSSILFIPEMAFSTVA